MFRVLRVAVCFALAWSILPLTAWADDSPVVPGPPGPGVQQITLVAVASPSGTVNVGSNISYVTIVSNGTETVRDFIVTNTLSPSTRLVTASATGSSLVTIDTNNFPTVTYTIVQLPPSQTNLLSLVVRTTTAGSVANLIEMFPFGLPGVVTNITTQVTTAQTSSDIAVSVSATSTSVGVNDEFGLEITLSNFGPDATRISFTNTFNSNIVVRSVSPPDLVTRNGQTVVFNIPSLASNASVTASIRLQLSVPGPFTYTAALSTANDPNPGNNTDSVTVTASALTQGSLMIARRLDPRFNPQNSLVEQRIDIMNTGSVAVSSARLVLVDFTNKVVNAVGTNDGNQFVEHAFPIQPTQTVSLVLEYFIPSRQLLDDPTFQLLAGGAVDRTASTAGTNVTLRPPKAVLDPWYGDTNTCMVEFAATRGLKYRILYRDTLGGTNELQALPEIVAQANRVQWIDHGPPKTRTHPTECPTNAPAAVRVYRVFQVP